MKRYVLPSFGIASDVQVIMGLKMYIQKNMWSNQGFKHHSWRHSCSASWCFSEKWMVCPNTLVFGVYQIVVLKAYIWANNTRTHEFSCHWSAHLGCPPNPDGFKGSPFYGIPNLVWQNNWTIPFWKDQHAYKWEYTRVATVLFQLTKLLRGIPHRVDPSHRVQVLWKHHTHTSISQGPGPLKTPHTHT